MKRKITKKSPFSCSIMKMAKRLKMDLSKFGEIDDLSQETWSNPLPEFIRMSYEKRFGKKSDRE